MKSVQNLETKIGGMFKGLPQLPENGKESLAKAWPWLALIFGVLQLLAAWGLWHLVHVVNVLNDYANTLSVYYTGRNVGPSSFDKTMIYLGIIVLVFEAVLFLMAYPALAKRQRKGWDLLFLAALVNLAYAVVTIFIQGRGVGSFIGSLLGSAVGFYLLFQVKEKFGKSEIANPANPTTPTTPSNPVE